MSAEDRNDSTKRLAELIELRSQSASPTVIHEPQNIASWADLEALASTSTSPDRELSSFCVPFPERDEASQFSAAGGYSMVPATIKIGEGKLEVSASWTSDSFECTWEFRGINPNTHLLFVFREETTGSILGHAFDAGSVIVGRWQPSPREFDADLSVPWRLEIVLLE